MVLRTAVVGTGTVSDTHLSGLDRCPRTELVAVCDIDERGARRVANEYGIRPYFDLDDLLAEEALDWLHVCTPIQTHQPLAMQAVEAGVPALIEKPITETMAEYEALETAARDNDVPVAAVHNHIYAPAMRTAMEQIRAGELGSVRGVDVVFTGLTPPDQRNRGSWAFDLTGGEFEEGISHPLYLGLAAAGHPREDRPIQSNTTLRGEYDEDFQYDAVQVQYVSQDDILCSIEMIADTVPQRIIHVHGERKSLAVDLLTQTVIELDGDYGGLTGRIRGNLDRVTARLRSVAENAYHVARRKRADDWESHKRINSHYYLFDEMACRLERNEKQWESFERAKQVVRITDAVREDSTGRRIRRPARKQTADASVPDIT